MADLIRGEIDEFLLKLDANNGHNSYITEFKYRH